MDMSVVSGGLTDAGLNVSSDCHDDQSSIQADVFAVLGSLCFQFGI